MTILKNIVKFTSLSVGVPVSQPHKLNVNEVAVVPQFIAADAPGFTIVADETTITVTRELGATASVDVFAERWHTIEDVEPAVGLAADFPFVVSGGIAPVPPPPPPGAMSLPIVGPIATTPLFPTVGNYYLVDAAAQTIQLFLPLAASVPNGAMLGVQNQALNSGNLVLVTRQGSDLINDEQTWVVQNSHSDPKFSAIFVSNGVDSWATIGDNTVYPSIQDTGGGPVEIIGGVTLQVTGAPGITSLVVTSGTSDLGGEQCFINGGLYLEGVTTPPALPTGVTNDYLPTDLELFTRIRQDCAAGAILGGLFGAIEGEVIVFTNISMVNNLTIQHLGAGSIPPNQFLLPGNTDMVVRPNGSVMFIYDTTSAKWRVMNAV